MAEEIRHADKLGWLGLGICIDYFLFRPFRKLRPLLWAAVGFFAGAFYTKVILFVVDWARLL